MTDTRRPSTTRRTMQATRADLTRRTLVLEEVPIPTPSPLEVLVRVKACGICLSDVHILDGSLPVRLPKVTLGHEAAGIVEEVGALVPVWRGGERVVISAGRSCGKCMNCIRGRGESECLRAEIMGAQFDGAWAEFVVVPYTSLAAVPDGIPFEQAAILADAVSTPYAGLVDRAALRAGESVGLWGIGGLGVHAVQIARMIGASPIIAVDPLAAARQRALAAGADVALDPTTDDILARVMQLTGGVGLDVSVDLVGANGVLAQAARCLGLRGRALMVGVSMNEVRLGPGLFFALQQQTLLGHLGYRKAHLDQLVALLAAGRLDLSRSVSDVIPLSHAAEGVARLTSKDGDPIRIVIAP
ncbi:MAG: zinc-binding dehydrogenase [Gemmatimonadaceae bacterium]